MLFGVRFELIISDYTMFSLKSIVFTNWHTYTLDMFHNLKCEQENREERNPLPQTRTGIHRGHLRLKCEVNRNEKLDVMDIECNGYM